ncbi:hypothetical protein [Streptomyces sp. NPDC088261]|uniref:hypothetical protein n=1 Tax=Streptomyces sp. NPDC088261 TaxID=3365851 RepID=UPI00380D4A74
MPEGWEWLDEVPQWIIPDELLGPASSPAVNLSIRMLSCNILSKDACALVGRFITESSLFTIWFLEDVKGSSRSMQDVALLLSASNEQTRLVFETWTKFEASLNFQRDGEDARALVRETGDRLEMSIRKAVGALAEIRKGAA